MLRMSLYCPFFLIAPSVFSDVYENADITTRFWNYLNQVRSKSKDWKTKYIASGDMFNKFVQIQENAACKVHYSSMNTIITLSYILLTFKLSLYNFAMSYDFQICLMYIY
jgi:hypothetical protein